MNAEAAGNAGPRRAVGVHLILFGADGRHLTDAFAPIDSGRGLSVRRTAADSLKKLRETSWPDGRVSRAQVEIDFVEEVAPGRYRYKLFDKIDGGPTRCVFQCEVSADNPVLAKNIGAFCRKESERKAAA